MQFSSIDTFKNFDNLDTLANFDNLFDNFDNDLGSQNILGTQNPSCLKVCKKSPDSVNSFDNIYMLAMLPMLTVEAI